MLHGITSRDADMLLLDDARLEARRSVIRGPLAPLYESLVAELDPLLQRDLFIPETKALLSRAGGRCEIDGARLAFDPLSPHEHICPACGTRHRGELHHRAWVTWYQLWLAERAVHAALFYRLRGDARHAQFARDVLTAYAGRYLQYPNQDNVLGPTRLFFSTYLESIWLLQICIAADLLRAGGDDRTADVVSDRIVEPSSALIDDYDEGMSNRQVWNNAALLAAGGLLSDNAMRDERVDADSGVLAHLTQALLADGTWYEGENYHQFALRGLWYCVILCERQGVTLETDIADRFHRGFEAPFLTALPDFTMPARKDSQYGVSLRQWRIAEMTELGLARGESPILSGALARCYEPGHPRLETGRARSAADVEFNTPSSLLSRANLSWRALLYALPELRSLATSTSRSALLENQGFAVFRRADDVYVGFDFGQSGGGHGHPDRLNVVLSQGSTRWLDDLGTGSYVDPSLHWYRSTLAHDAPLIDGRSQPIRDGALRAYDEREGLGWIAGEFFVPDTQTRIERALVVAPGYVIDELRWTSPNEVRLELPWHLDATPQGLAFQPSALDGGDGLEDGFSFVTDARALSVAAGEPVTLEARSDGEILRGVLVADDAVKLFSACAPGQPASTSRRFYLVRSRGKNGRLRTALIWDADVEHVDIASEHVTVVTRAGERHVHRRDDSGWHVELLVGAARSTIDLAGFRARPDDRQEPLPAARAPTVLRRAKLSRRWYSELTPAERRQLLVYELGEQDYRRSEDRWKDAGSPRATIAFAADHSRLIVYAAVAAGERRFAPSSAANPLDNEQADTMSAGVQLYVRMPEASGAWMLIPESDHDAVRVRPITAWGTWTAPTARWHALNTGYELRIELPLPERVVGAEFPIDVDVIVNETTLARERRRGQLVMSGARDEFVYLRGDRHDPARLIPLVLVS